MSIYRTLIIFVLICFSGYSLARSCKLPSDGRISGNVELNSDCVYEGRIIISTSGTRLDCRGATIDGGNVVDRGIVIARKGNLEKVIVENCKVLNYKQYGIYVTSAFNDLEKTGKGEPWSYDNSPKNIIIRNVVVENSGDGVYFGSHVTYSILNNSTIKKSSKVGVYLDHSSAFNRIEGNIIEKNGYGSSSNLREGLAIDSSSDNTIAGNYFINNASGGVFLYKNCGELYSSGRSFLRKNNSDRNKILNNFFFGEKTAVWIASRQSKDLRKMDCAASPMKPGEPYFEDFANENEIIGNYFCSTNRSVVVEGDNNKVINNFISGRSSVVIPKTMREVILHRPSIGNNVAPNFSTSCEIE